MKEEYEIEETPAEQIVKHFTQQETTEEDLRAIHDLKVEIESLKGLLEAKIAAVKEQNRGMETVQRGKYVAVLTTVSGRVSTDWSRFVKDQIGKVDEATIRPYIKRSDDTVRLEVKRIDG